MELKPVLFICFNRPEETAESFAVIRSARPKELFVSIDGPRNEAEKTQVDEVQRITEQVDWDCSVSYLVHTENQGCRNAVNQAIDWFFTHVEAGIILEDDIVPSDSFFGFCSLLLERYMDDKRIMLITGNNLLGESNCMHSYFFSKIGAIWGWATWRRAWQLHDKEMSSWPTVKESPISKQILPEELWEERVRIFDRVYHGKIDTWDYQFTYTRLINSGLSIVPKWNMIKNIGFNDKATHTESAPVNIDNKSRSIDLIKVDHPLVVIPDLEFDRQIFENRQNSPTLGSRIISKIKSLNG